MIFIENCVQIAIMQVYLRNDLFYHCNMYLLKTYLYRVFCIHRPFHLLAGGIQKITKFFELFTIYDVVKFCCNKT